MPEICVSDLSFSYGRRRIFNQFSLSLKGSGIYTLLGPSGCGKTTLLRILLGLERPDAGEVSLSEQPAAVFQEHRLFPHLTALQNVTVIGDANETALVEAKQLLLDLGFTESETSLYPAELSGGMKQRVALARAFFSPSSILLLDEPSKELDHELRETLYRKLTERAEHALILLSTHRTEETERLSATPIHLE